MKVCKNHSNRKVFSKGLCVQCYKIQFPSTLKRTPLKKRPSFINPISDRRKQQRKEYKPKRDRFLDEHPLCQLKLKGCTIKATAVHHTKGCEGELLLAEQWWKATCSHCHRIITDASKQAIENGNSLSRHKK